MIPSPPRRQTRQSIERELEDDRRRRQLSRKEFERRIRVQVEVHKAQLRDNPADEFARRQMITLTAMLDNVSRRRLGPRGRRPRDGSMPALVEPPRGPTPLTGGAAAPLEFDD